MRFHPVLAIGLTLNFIQMVMKHLGIYQKLPIPEKAQDFLAGFLTGAAMALLFFGLILTLRPEWMEKVREWKMNLFGGN